MNLHAERLGDWNAYIKSLKLMLPFFASSGHRNYTKCLYWFLQEIENLPPTITERFVNGEWVVRRTAKAYSGVSLDLFIEQSLMSSLKGNQGLTRGRGFNQMNHLTWVLNRPVMCAIDRKMRDMTNVDLKLQSEQSSVKAQRKSRLVKDRADMETIRTFLTERLLFQKSHDCLVNIATGLKAPSDCNVHHGLVMGQQILDAMVDKNPLDMKIPKAMLAKQIPDKSKIVNQDTGKSVDPQLLFQRALRLANESEDNGVSLEEVLGHELNAVALSLFDINGFMRSGIKSDLASVLVSVDESVIEKELPQNDPQYVYVIDGGYLLHKIVWVKGDTFQNIINCYPIYLSSLSSSPVSIIFDGYERSTKDHIHSKRQPISSLEIDFTLQSILLSTKQVFLSNVNNKENFIDKLSEILVGYGHTVTRSNSDADVDIVNKAMTVVMSYNCVLVGDDTDLLVLLLHHFSQIAPTTSNNVYMYRPASDTVINIRSLLLRLPAEISNNILFLHAVSGCDTTSSIAGIGKTKFIKSLMKNNNIIDGKDIDAFYDSNVSPDRLYVFGMWYIGFLCDPKGKNDSFESIRLR